MTLAGPVVLWDFDGTLARRPGLWSACVLEVLDEHAGGHRGTLECVRAELKGAFPWHRHEQPHPELCDAERWWQALTPALERAIHACGVERVRTAELARAVRTRFVDGTRGWQLFDDARPALEHTAGAGWRNAILSNHVPELDAIVRALGLGGLVERVFSSACSGYEKPHPQAFRDALAALGDPRQRWMVGDNPRADVAGAEALGIPAILVHGEQRDDTPAPRRARDLARAAALIAGC